MISQLPHHRVRLTECPICGAKLRYKTTAAHIASEHGPADFGLSPLRGGK